MISRALATTIIEAAPMIAPSMAIVAATIRTRAPARATSDFAISPQDILARSFMTSPIFLRAKATIRMPAAPRTPVAGIRARAAPIETTAPAMTTRPFAISSHDMSLTSSMTLTRILRAAATIRMPTEDWIIPFVPDARRVNIPISRRIAPTPRRPFLRVSVSMVPTSLTDEVSNFRAPANMTIAIPARMTPLPLTLIKLENKPISARITPTPRSPLPRVFMSSLPRSSTAEAMIFRAAANATRAIATLTIRRLFSGSMTFVTPASIAVSSVIITPMAVIALVRDSASMVDNLAIARTRTPMAIAMATREVTLSVDCMFFRPSVTAPKVFLILSTKPSFSLPPPRESLRPLRKSVTDVPMFPNFESADIPPPVRRAPKRIPKPPLSLNSTRASLTLPKKPTSLSPAPLSTTAETASEIHPPSFLRNPPTESPILDRLFILSTRAWKKSTMVMWPLNFSETLLMSLSKTSLIHDPKSLTLSMTA